jgi:hypothetical protein
MDLEIRHLRVVTAIAETGSISVRCGKTVWPTPNRPRCDSDQSRGR